MYRIAIDLEQKQNEQICLTSEQQHYLYRVLRLRQGDRFVVIDGRGYGWIAQLQREAQAQVVSSLETSTELAIAVTLMVALPKGNGFEQVVRSCTELGVTTLLPVISDRTLLKPSLHKLERWRKIAQEAAEQSERQIIPAIAEPVDFASACQIEGTRYICMARREVPHLLEELQRLDESIIMATGPEGGWTKAEVEMAVDLGFRPVSLGRRILRAVTAPVVALSLVAARDEMRAKDESAL